MAAINIVSGCTSFEKIKWVLGTLQYYLKTYRIAFQMGSEVRPSQLESTDESSVISTKDLDLQWESGMDVWYDVSYECHGDVLVGVPASDEANCYTFSEVVDWLHQNPSLLQANADIFPRIWFVSDGSTASFEAFVSLYNSFGQSIPFVLAGCWAVPAAEDIQQAFNTLIQPLTQNSNVSICPAFWIDPVCEKTLSRYDLDLTSVAEFSFKTRLGTYRLHSAVRSYSSIVFQALEPFWNASSASILNGERVIEGCSSCESVVSEPSELNFVLDFTETN